MIELQLACLGEFQVTLGGTVLPPFQTDKSRALLIYLICEAQVHTRTALAELLWPGYSEESARNSLRQTLHQLRQTLAKATPAGEEFPWFLLTRQTVQVNPTAPIRVDALTFRHLLATTGSHAHADLLTCAPCVERLRQAVALYRGDFLADFTVDDSARFEEWRRTTQERFQLQLLDALAQVAVAAEMAGDVAQALHAAERLLTLEPWHEGTHRQLMRLLALQGQRNAALAQYQRCRQVLREALGVEPDAATTALAEAIRSGEWGRSGELSEMRGPQGEPRLVDSTPPPTPPQAPLPADRNRAAAPLLSAPLPPDPLPSASLPALCDWTEMPAVDFFVERSAEVAQLTEWLMPPTPRQGTAPQLISILGMGGMGKTTLAARVTKAVAPSFAVVIWRSLLNAPPCGQLVRNWLQLLSRQSLTTLPDSLDEQLRLLLTYLQNERCLLVLDNFESIFATETLDTTANPPSPSLAGVSRPGYEGYDLLLQRLANSDHQSCLLLTSREQPAALVRLGRQAQSITGRTRVLPLQGLDPQAGSALLELNGLQASATDAAQLVVHYSGNPLALQIVAATIIDFFGGDVEAFQQEEGQIFDGIRLVLDQQFARLSALERDILVWLAIEREAITVATLRSNFTEPIATAPLLEALQALQNRSLLEKREGGFTLQNVIIEYTTDYLVDQVCQEIVDEFRAPAAAAHAAYRAAVADEQAAGALEARNTKLVSACLNRFALLKAQAKEYARQSQARLILQPVAQQLVQRLGQSGLLARSQELLERLRRQAPRTPGYAAGNLLNLLLALGVDLTNYDFSHLSVWQPYLRETTLPQLNFTNADLRGAAFTDTFDIVRALAYSPDGRFLAAGTSDGEIRLWRATDGQLLAHAKGHGDIVSWLCFLDQGKTLISYSHDLALVIWQVDTTVTDGAGNAGEAVTLRLHYRNTELSNLTNLVAFHPPDGLLAFATERGWLCLWHLGTKRRLGEQTVSGGQIHALRFSPDGKTLVMALSDRRLYLWAVDAGVGRLTLRQTLAEMPAVARDLCFHPDGRTLASAHDDGSIYLWALAAAGDSRTGQALQRLSGHRARVWRLAFSPDGQLLASSSDDHSVRLWKMGELPASAAAQPVARFDEHRGWVRALAFSLDGLALASAGADRTIRVWDLRSAQLLYTFYGYVRAVKSLAFCPNSSRLVSGSDDQRVRLWDAADGRCLQTWAGHTSFIWQVAVSPDGHLVASAGDDCQIYVRDVSSGQVRNILSGHESGVTAVAFSPDSKLLVSGGLDCRVIIWDMQAPAGRSPLIRAWAAATQVVWAVAFSPNGEYLAFGGEPNRVRLWHLPSQQFHPALENETGVLRTLAFSPDSRWLAAGGHNAIVYLWQVGSGAPPILFAGHQDKLRSVAFSPDGRRLATASFDQTVRLWDLQTQTQLCTLQGHSNQVLAVAFSSDGAWLASASEDETIRLWDGQTGAPLSVLPMPGPYVGMQIAGVTGISEAQKAALRALGAVER